MQHDSLPKPSPLEGVAPTAGAQQLSAAALARRRALVKGLGKGGAAVVASVPIRSFADEMLFPGVGICTVSGNMSAVSSHTSSHPKCISRTPRDFLDPASWPAGLLPDTLTFQALFNGSGDTAKVKDILNGPAGDPRRYWVTAIFNGKLKATDPAITFYYTEAEVRDFYFGPRSTDFLAFLHKIWD